MSNFWYINKYHLISLIIAIGVFFIPINDNFLIYLMFNFLFVLLFCISSYLYDYGNFNNKIECEILDKLEHFQYDKILLRLWFGSLIAVLISLILQVINLLVETNSLYKICYSLLAFGFVENLILFIFLFKIYKRGTK